ncbi:MAG: NAD(P)/FAD-dependent oxidoreductase [Vampirovibrionales bacterium]
MSYPLSDAHRSTPSVWDTLIVGAGASGTMAGHCLQNQGRHVTLWEKARGVGGRMSTRRATLPTLSPQEAETMPSTCYYDHGAQFIRFASLEASSHAHPPAMATEPQWHTLVQSWCQNASLLTPWFAGDPAYPEATQITPETQASHTYPDATLAWAGTHGMVTLPKHLSKTLPVATSHLVTGLTYHPENTVWEVTAEVKDPQTGATHTQQAHSQHVVLTAPLPQTLALLKTIDLTQWEPAQKVVLEDATFAMSSVMYHPCYALMLTVPVQALAPPLKQVLPWPGVMPYEVLQKHAGLETPLGWVGVSQAKQLMPTCVDETGQAWVSLTVQSAPEWTWQHVEEAPEVVEAALYHAMQDVVLQPWFVARCLETLQHPSQALPLTLLRHKALHRWRYSAVNPYTLSPALKELTQQKGYIEVLPKLWVAGDGLIGGRVESALRSGYEVAQAILQTANLSEPVPS